MTAKEAIEKAIRHFKCVRDDAQVVLDSGFGTHKGESDLVYRNRKMYAELAIEALEKQIPKKPDVYSDGYADGYEVWEEHCPNCEYDFDGHNPSYCPRCGQAIDWSEEE